MICVVVRSTPRSPAVARPLAVPIWTGWPGEATVRSKAVICRPCSALVKLAGSVCWLGRSLTRMRSGMMALPLELLEREIDGEHDRGVAGGVRRGGGRRGDRRVLVQHADVEADGGRLAVAVAVHGGVGDSAAGPPP